MFVCYECLYMSAAPTEAKRRLDPLELELQEVMGCLTQGPNSGPPQKQDVFLTTVHLQLHM